jgi:hypothetical protein
VPKSIFTFAKENKGESTMDILVVGSLRCADKYENENEKKLDKKFVDENMDNFKEACRQLGAAFARKHHTIMVGVPDWSSLKDLDTVTTFMIEGVNQVPIAKNTKHKVIFYGPEESEPKDTTVEMDSLKEIRALKNIDLEIKYMGGGPSKARTIPNISDVGAVMLIAGKEGTESIGYAAYSMGKPVIVLPSFGGAAESVAKEVLYDEYNLLYRESYLSGTDIDDLKVEWNIKDKLISEKADRVVAVSERLVSAYNQKDKRTGQILKTTTTGVILLIALWIALFMSSVQCTAAKICGAYVNVSFFILLLISSLLGAGLRTLIGYQKNKEKRLDLQDVNIDFVIAMLVAFGLALFYLIGGISFTGSVVVLEAGAEGQSFATVAVSLSLLGLAAGYLVPLDFLGGRLRKLVSEEKKSNPQS